MWSFLKHTAIRTRNIMDRRDYRQAFELALRALNLCDDDLRLHWVIVTLAKEVGVVDWMLALACSLLICFMYGCCKGDRLQTTLSSKIRPIAYIHQSLHIDLHWTGAETLANGSKLTSNICLNNAWRWPRRWSPTVELCNRLYKVIGRPKHELLKMT